MTFLKLLKHLSVRRISLAHKLLAAVAGMVFFVVALILFTSLSNDYLNDLSVLKKRGLLLVEDKASAISLPLWNLSMKEVNEHLNLLEKYPNFTHARLEDPNGKVLYELGIKNSDFNDITFKKEVAYKDLGATQPLGNLELSLSKTELHNALFDSLIKTIFVFCILLVCILFAIYRIIRLILIKPMDTLVDTMQQVAGGNLTLKVPIYSNDELGTVARVFNKMTSNLRDIYKTIENQLEHKSGELSKSESSVKSAQKLAYDALTQWREEKKRSDQLLHDSIDINPAAIILVDKDDNLAMWNQNFAALIPDERTGVLKEGSPLSDVISALFENIKSQEKTRAIKEFVMHFMSREPFEHEFLDQKWYRITTHVTKNAYQAVMFVDISDLKEREASLEALNQDLKGQAEELKTSREQYVLATQGANDGIWDWNLETNEVFYSERFREMLGLSADHSLHTIQDWIDRIHPQDRQRVQTQLDDHLNKTTERFESEFQIRHEDGTYLWMLCRGLASYGPDGKATRMAGSQTDITVRKTYEDQLVHSAFHDSLTGLPNRALFLNRLDEIISSLKRPGTPQHAIMFLDLDRFKVINDSLGHAAGDELLKSVAKRIKDNLRPTDFFARLGGDEFIILLSHINSEKEASVAADRVRDQLCQPFILENREIYVSGSVGITLVNDPNQTADSLVRNADLAMYRAKELGRSRSELFDQALHTRVLTELQVETDLRKALERNEIIVHYQPLIELKTGKITSFEALARWKHPERGIVPQNLFISVAEETGLIIPIGDFILQEACRQTMEWRTTIPGSENVAIAVNISTKQIADKVNADNLIQRIEELNMPKDVLKIELTESAIVEDPDYADAILRRIKSKNVALCIDDFGTGYSSFSYLHRFPFDVLKIDRVFVVQMTQNKRDFRLVKGINELSHDLGLKVVAEGVETLEELEMLHEIGVDYAQGYFFSRPVEPEAAAALLAKADGYIKAAVPKAKKVAT